VETQRIGELDRILLRLIDRHGDDVVRTLLCGESRSLEKIEDELCRFARGTSDFSDPARRR